MKTQSTKHKAQIKHNFQNTKQKQVCAFSNSGSGFYLYFVKSVFCDFRSRERPNGYAAVTTTILALVVTLTIVGGFTLFTLKEVNINRIFTKSIESRAISESGIEDGVYRVLTNKQLASGETLAVGKGTTTITLTALGNQKTIRSEGKRDNIQQNFESRVDTTATGVNFNYGVQVGEGGLTMDNNSSIKTF